jgi:hypothetical protein
MKKFVIFSLIGAAIIAILVIVIGYIQLRKTKSFSPEEEVVYTQDDLSLKIFYNRPFKKNREIFGALVPYNEVWRTGANEATTFETSKNLVIEGKILKAGKYTLWTIPRADRWTIIFNTEHDNGQWGINPQGKANRNPEHDALNVDVAPVWQDQVFEQFTISFEKSGEDIEMVLAWDKTLVALPMSPAGN